MAELKDITGIGKASLELLDAAGIRNSTHLSEHQPDELHAELLKANDVLSLVKRPPGVKTVRKWIIAAEAIETAENPVPESEAKEAPDKPVDKPAEKPIASNETPQPIAPPVDYESRPEVAEMLANAPCAIPLPGKIMMERKLRVGDIPAGLLLNRYSGDLDVRIENLQVEKKAVSPRNTSQSLETGMEDGAVKPMQAKEKGKRIAKSRKKDHEMDRVALIRTPLEKTNRGKNPESRRYIRGVLHTHPISLRVGALSTLLLFLALPLAVIATFLLLGSREMPDSLPWVPQWILVFPIALPVVGIIYFIWGFQGKCRICTQKLFVHKAALKHIKAHRAPGLGYVFPLCIHLLAFSWFRCSSCGTPVRLKK